MVVIMLGVCMVHGATKTVAVWKMDESAGTMIRDSSGNKNDAAAFNVADENWSPSEGKQGGVLSLDSRSAHGCQFIKADTTAWAKNYGMKNWTISLWIKPMTMDGGCTRSTGAFNYIASIACRDGNGNPGARIDLFWIPNADSTSGALGAAAYFASGAQITPANNMMDAREPDFLTCNYRVVPNTWQQVSFRYTRDGGDSGYDRMEILYNGQVVRTANYWAHSADPASNLTMGDAIYFNTRAGAAGNYSVGAAVKYGEISISTEISYENRNIIRISMDHEPAGKIRVQFLKMN